MEDLTHTMIGKYELLRQIGEGGMGAVYEARHRFVKRRCALKLLNPKYAKNKEVMQRMLREAQAAAAIGHPNIVETYDFGITDEGVSYLVMEFLQGRSLAEELEARTRLPVPDAVSIMLQVLYALEVAHQKGVVHRDLKPDNVFLVQPTHGPSVVKLLDFGISRFMDDDAEASRLTQTGMIMGTPYYMSPEQTLGAANTDARTDLWAIGVILYECLTGRLPFQGRNLSHLVLRINTEEPVRPRTLCSDIAVALEQAILRALKKNPEHRYREASLMIADLRPYATPDAGADRTYAETLLSHGGVARERHPPTSDTGASEPDVWRHSTTSRPASSSESGTEVEASPQDDFSGSPLLDPLPTSDPSIQNPLSETEETAAKRLASSTVAPVQIMTWDGVSGVDERHRDRWFVRAGIAVLVVSFSILGYTLLSRALESTPPTNKHTASMQTPQLPADAGVDAGRAIPPDASPSAKRPKPSVVTPRPPLRLAPSPLPQSANGETPPSKLRPVSDNLEIEIVGAPHRAHIWLDGKRASSSLVVPADGERHTVRIRARGYHAFERSFVARRGLARIRVTLRGTHRRHRRPLRSMGWGDPFTSGTRPVRRPRAKRQWPDPYGK